MRPVRHASIAGTGGYLPERIVDNEEVCAGIDSTDEWIVRRSGIRRRRFAGPQESLAVMGHAAGTKALAAAGIPVERVDCVIATTMSHLRQAPALATRIAHLLGGGAQQAAGFDVNAGCAGFCYALGLARDLVAAGSAEHVLVVGVERMSDIVDRHDRTSAFLFGDGAGAVVVSPSDIPGIAPVVWGSDSDHGDAIAQPHGWGRLRDDPDAGYPYLRMQGPTVFRWAVTRMREVALAALAAARVDVADLVAFVPHQANERITDALVQALGLPPDVLVARDVTELGNTAAASVPLALDRLVSRAPEAGGGPALLLGFGAGLLYAGQVVRLP
ncbi:beta-ketoacyl-ACP synthase 3 [Micromonospora sp. R77]|uniref:beta-ketoacyl-ACP synthase 3 n=1 Tax=Micromonospora sp. R77 TaxID=2925836 RepID=UPI001F601449|nr:beta-ketoacyl-ACP synthase 3 [Micromonospora sp. R77]MCI4066754.1 beta-ketoacyl-ACP synthase 3 [Micromonospora sp. R77]